MPTLFGSASIDIVAAALLGLLLGSFLNVVIHRLPKMLERQWAQDCAELSGVPAQESAPYNLVLPRSACTSCGHQITWYENIPVLSYLVLRGRCSACGAPISWRYPMVELLTAALCAFCVSRWGWSLTAACWSGFSAAMVALAYIDWDTTLLPDDITLSLLWAGLIASAVGWTALPLSASVWGAAAGYLFLWSIYWGFKLLTGKEGMGHGDFKLLAALGAWFGWQALIPLILVASVIGAIVGLILKFRSELREGGYVPFGPFLTGAGLLTMLTGTTSMLGWVGL